MAEPVLFTRPADLTLVSDSELTAAYDAAKAEFTRVKALSDYTPQLIDYAKQLTTDLDLIKAELGARETRATLTAQSAQDAAQQTMAQLASRVEGEPAAQEPVAAALDVEAVVAAAAKGTLETFMKVMGDRGARQMASMTAAAQHQQDPALPQRTAMLQVTTSMDIPKHAITAGAVVTDIAAMAEAFETRAKSIPTSQIGAMAPRWQVATVRNEFDHTVDIATSPPRVMDLHESMTTRDKAEALLAGGGWCAPSEIRYDLFNIAEPPVGQIDLPTVGVTRGGIQYPSSPAIGDVFFTNAGSNPASGMGSFAFAFSNATDPWLWTETDDINTVTGSVNKPTLRVPCPTFSTTRLEAYGITLTAGNLTDSAYPEMTQNFLKLLRAAWAHAINARLISLMVTASGGANTIGAITTDPAAPRIFNAVALAATDYRARYAMRNDAVLEVVMPYWVKEHIRADLAYKVGIDSPELFAAMDPTIDSFFTARGVRVQWVDDWQVRGANQMGNATVQLVWQTTVQFMIYAAGTFLHGTGLQLDLGVVRDSVLNAENDFTAAWAEEAHLIAMVGHASRLYTCAFQVNGSSGGGTTARV